MGNEHRSKSQPMAIRERVGIHSWNISVAGAVMHSHGGFFVVECRRTKAAGVPKDDAKTMNGSLAFGPPRITTLITLP
jgi:hypothetical protein